MFLGVGTIEPRKAWSVALDAMERLWRDEDAHLVLVGRYGWSSHWLQGRIEHHPEFGKRLHWLNDADDTTLSSLYRDATALVYPSVAEGFGLPLIEARHFGTPVIASDIEIFREIAGDAIDYFRLLDPDDLARQMRRALHAPRKSPDFPLLSWEEATRSMLQLARDLVMDRPNARRID